MARGRGDPGAPRVRLLGLSYILVFGSAMVQIIAQPRGLDAEILGGLMVLGGLIVIVVVFLEARASRRSIARLDRLGRASSRRPTGLVRQPAATLNASSSSSRWTGLLM